ncbi:Spy/CpxP family protein refolding chaperone [Tundrisphaera sp. TA3]|uniref:Spy/CpxP family protein refolding chaperone n=1 Tax=Tundrisphaera sp. TA3 TaxID=3435775 RepID=UPI003EB9D0CA
MKRNPPSSQAGPWLVALGLLLPAVAPPGPAAGQDTPAPAPSQPRLPLSARRGVNPPPVEPKPAAGPATEAKPATDPAKPDADKEGFLGDTKKFTRLGGWGSMGGAMGQFGVAKSLLVMMPPVQDELKLTDDQKRKLREVQDETRKRGEALGKSMREKGSDPLGGGEDTSIMARVGQFTGMMSRVSELMRENEEAFSEVLTAKQKKRLGQIALQMEGITALTRPEIAEALGLYPIEQENIQQIVAQARMMQMTSMVGTMMTMRPDRTARRGTDRPASGEATPTSKDATAKDAAPKEAADPRARAEREKAVREKFTALRDNNDQIQDRAVREISRYLNKAQRAKFLNMLGPPFDPAQLNTLGRPPGRPEPKPGEARPKAEAR